MHMIEDIITAINNVRKQWLDYNYFSHSENSMGTDCFKSYLKHSPFSNILFIKKNFEIYLFIYVFSIYLGCRITKCKLFLFQQKIGMFSTCK